MKIYLLFCFFIILTFHINSKEIIYFDLEELKHYQTIILAISPQTGIIKFASNSAIDYYGYENLIGMNISEINQLTEEEIQKEMDSAKSENRNYFRFKHKLSNNDIRDVEVNSYPMKFNKDLILVSTIRDITEELKNKRRTDILTIFIVLFLLGCSITFFYLLKKISAKNSENQNKNKQIISLLSEKKMLLNETHHRIKNNMNVIRSILLLEANKGDNTNCQEVLNDCANRMMTMMTLYDYLYNNEIKQEIDISYYIKNLVEQFTKIYKHKSIKTEVNIPEIYLTPKIISKIGIIVNELFTNSVKYAFEGIDNPIIFLSINKDDDVIKIVYSDNGKGLPETISFENAETFGLKLISMLVKEIQGTIVIDRKSGTKFIIKCVITEQVKSGILNKDIAD